MTVDTNDPRPAYAQVAEHLRSSIRAGHFAPGEKLPAGRELASQYGVAMMTVKRALDVLRSDGLVVSQQGRGVFVSTAGVTITPLDELRQLKTAVGELSRRIDALEDRLTGAN
jgi:DNA-binding GntR family transcriptional regulator